MKIDRARFESKPVIRVMLCAALGYALLALTPVATAGPGAHGPNGEHLDDPVTMRAAPDVPRVEAASEDFELVAELRHGSMAIILDRYATNEPVVGAKIEVESGALKATAGFRAEHGDYVVADAALLKALEVPGEHGLVFTVVTAQESDLLEATLQVATTDAAATEGGLDHALVRGRWVGAGVVALGLIGGLVWWRGRGRRHSGGGSLRGGL